MTSIGIMDPAFFVGKNVLLNWLNDFFEVNYTKVEQCASGALYCQIMDCLYPGSIQLSKVNFAAKFDYEFVKNWKLVQEVFTKQNIEKFIPVDKLVKAKYQDNLEFLQWMKNFFETKYAGQEYHAKERREKAGIKVPGGGKSKMAAPAAPKPKAAAKPAEAKAAPAAKPAAKKAVAKKPAAGGAEAKDEPVDDGALDAAKAELDTLKETVEGLERERNFYFGKLREIEILCQEGEEEGVESASPTKRDVLAILYKTDEDEDFQAPAEEATAAE